jgi:hypothetical protein
VIVVAALAACAGPKPKARVIDVEPSPVAGHERVTLAIDNRSGGEGEVDIRIVLHGPATIVTSQTVDLRGHDHVQLFVDIAAPPGAYRATVDAQFPD